MNRSEKFTALILIAAVSFVYASTGPDPVHLVKISKGVPDLEELFRSGNMMIVQELRTCFIGRLTRNEIAGLRESGAVCTGLVRNVGEEAMYLVRPSAGVSMAGLAGKGRMLEIEPDTWLFRPARDASVSVTPGLMIRRLSRLSIVPNLRVYAPIPVSAPKLAWNPVIEEIVGEVSSGNLMLTAAALQNFGTRYTASPHCLEASEMIRDAFINLGLEADVQTFTYDGLHEARNVVAVITGTTFPDEDVIICAHYDSTSPTPYEYAPGADDNASGTAAVIEAARILSRHPLDFTVRFIAFSAEEQGLHGSSLYAGLMKSQGRRIVGVVNLDMIAYADQMPEDLDVFVNPASEWLGERIREDAAEYASLSVRTTVDPSMIYSDHSPFWQNGYAAFLGIEDSPLTNPYYHRIDDTVDTLTPAFFSEAAKAALATVAVLAQPVRPDYPSPPRGLEGRASYFASFISTTKSVYLNWTASAEAAGYNVYRGTMPRVGYEKVNSGPVAGSSYVDRGVPSGSYQYYVITAVGPSGLESNFSRVLEIPPVPRKLKGSG
jgi:hypothetical protein